MTVQDLASVSRSGEVTFRLHPGQNRAWNSQSRFVAVLAGTQSGKTAFGPLWLYREMKRRGAGTYLIAGPSIELLRPKVIPEFRRLFEQQLKLGKFYESPRPRFDVSKEGEKRLFGAEQAEPTVIRFGYGSDPDTLESMTAKAAWLDEPGQEKFLRTSWEAVQRRLSLHQGRCLFTTTPYTTNHWIKTDIYDRRHSDPDVDVISFRSIQNPAFPREEWERAKRTLPRWRFRMMYCGVFTKPAGAIYDVFSRVRHVVPYPAVPDRWAKYAGIDFGGVNTAAVFLMEDPGDGRLTVYRTYHDGNKTVRSHMTSLLAGEVRTPIFYGGAPSEQAWRDEYTNAGLGVSAPVTTNVELGIDAVYALFATGDLVVSEACTDLLSEIESYSRVIDANGDPTDAIANKSSYHLLDALRYIIGSIRATQANDGFSVDSPGIYGYDNTGVYSGR